MKFSFKDIQPFLPENHIIEGDTALVTFSNTKPVFESNPLSISRGNPTRLDKNELLQNTNAGVVICDFDTTSLKK